MNDPEKHEVLLVDPDLPLQQFLVDGLSAEGFSVRTASSVQEGLDIINENPPPYAVFALRFGNATATGLDLLAVLKDKHPDARVVIITRFGDIPTAVAAMKMGAVDFKLKPVAVTEIVAALLRPTDTIDKLHAAVDPDRLRAEYIWQQYRSYGGNLAETARRLGMHRRSLQRTLKKTKPKP
jgi:two-component system response regulator RegA